MKILSGSKSSDFEQTSDDGFLFPHFAEAFPIHFHGTVIYTAALSVTKPPQFSLNIGLTSLIANKLDCG